jgi:hypothetical protein
VRPAGREVVDVTDRAVAGPLSDIPDPHLHGDIIVDHTQGDPVEQIMELTGGNGVDAAIEAYGSPRTFSFGEIRRAFEMMAGKEDNIIEPLITFG